MKKSYEFCSSLKSYFQEYLKIREASLTKESFSIGKHYLENFDAFLSERRILQDSITETVVYSWNENLPFSNRTVISAVSTLRMFLKYLHGCGLKAFIPDLPKFHDNYVPYIYTDEEVERIMKLADSGWAVGRNPYLKVEIPMILRLLQGCGLRIGETLSLKTGDVDFNRGLLIMKHTKRDKQRVVPMHSQLTEILKRYCVAMGIYHTTDKWLFPGMTTEKHLRLNNVDVRCKKMLAEASIPLSEEKNQRGPCLHCFRHLFVVRSFHQLEKQGIHIDDTVPYLSIYLGHDNLMETEKYMKFSSDMFPEEMEKFNEYIEGLFPEVDYEE